jgi:hypothetical protein
MNQQLSPTPRGAAIRDAAAAGAASRRLTGPGSHVFTDVTPDAAADALGLADPFFANSRPNDQPPATWLVGEAARGGGRVQATVTDWFENLRIDQVCLPLPAGEGFLRRLWAAYPDAAGLVLVEWWTDWQAERSCHQWTPEDESAPLPPVPGATVVGFWWD